MDNWSSIVALLIAFETTVIGGIWGFAWFLSRKFNNIYDKIQETLDTMITKLEYHEQHDDKRFTQLTDGIWALRLENALSGKKFKVEDKKEV